MKNYFYAFFAVSALALFTLSSPAQAAYTPVAVSIIPPIQLPPEDFIITGVRFNLLAGEHHSVYGFDLGLVNITNNNFVGVQLGGFNLNKGETVAIGAQAGLIGNFNVNKARIYGLQAGLYNSNKAESQIWGFAVGAVNNDPFTTVVGAQFGIYNKAGNVYGLQIGLINSAEVLHGVQIGLLNFNVHGLFAVAPILNVGF